MLCLGIWQGLKERLPLYGPVRTRGWKYIYCVTLLKLIFQVSVLEHFIFWQYFTLPLNILSQIPVHPSLHIFKTGCIWGELSIISILLHCTAPSQHHKTDFKCVSRKADEARRSEVTRRKQTERKTGMDPAAPCLHFLCFQRDTF